ncbi:MAG: putative metal-binding motif-containing protein [Deltaproteobacteria bacterium]|nr:putative metal-binding motif-containing protein [Deltaproteobacteria bacterium]
MVRQGLKATVIGAGLLAAACTHSPAGGAGEPCGGSGVCQQGFLCLDDVCRQVCSDDYGCPKALACVDSVCLPVNTECIADADCRATTLCQRPACRGGLCRYDPVWSTGSADPQPLCPLVGDDGNQNGVMDNGEAWNGYCGHDGVCAPCTEDPQCDDGDSCSRDTCVNQSCTNEPGAICGGGCSLCADGEPCSDSLTCVSRVCAGTCQPATCVDGVKNGLESGIDCGGAGSCPRCANGAGCSRDGDCASGICAGRVCDPGNCTGNATRSCGSDVGECVKGLNHCIDGFFAAVCDGETGPAPEVCDGKDNDCDGVVDPGCGCPSGTWVSETIAADGDVGQWGQVAVAASGAVHACFYDATSSATRDLMYAFHAPSGFWVRSVVDRTGDVGPYSRVAVDNLSGVHLAYYDATARDLRYAYKAANGSWGFSTVDTDGNVGQFASIAVDPDRGVHIAYRDASNQDLKYAYRAATAGSFTLSPALVTAGNVGEHTSIAADKTGAVHISYYDASAAVLRYLRKPKGGSFTAPAQVDAATGTGQYSALAVDSTGGVHVVYYDAANVNLNYRYLAPLLDPAVSGNWAGAVVDAVGNVGQHAAIAIDKNDGVHVAYYDATSGKHDLKYAYRQSAAVPWSTPVTVSANGNVGTAASIAVDGALDVEITYYDADNRDLKFAYRPAGTSAWIDSVIDSVGNVGSYGSVAADSGGATHVAYYDAGAGVLRYAFRSAGGVWTVAAIDTGGSVGKYCDVAVDAGGGAHLSYYDETNTGLKYIHCSAGGSCDAAGTAVDDVAGSPNVGQYSAIAVAGDGDLAIVYYDLTNTDLKYAFKPAGGSFSVGNVDAGSANVGQYAALVADAANGFHASYYDASNANEDLRYASSADGTTWTPVTADTASNAGRYSAIAVDGAGLVHVTSMSTTGGAATETLREAMRDSGGLWTFATVDGGFAGEYGSLAYAPSGLAYASYRKGAPTYDQYGALAGVTAQLAVAVRSPADGSWSASVLDGDGEVGLYTSVAIHPSGAVSIVYYDATRADFRHMYRCP